MRRVAVLLAGACSFAPVGSEAQASSASVAEVVAAREMDFRAARSEYFRAYERWESTEREWNQLVNEREAARRSGNRTRVGQIYTQVQGLSGKITQAENEVRALRERWYDAGDALVDALDAHLELLGQQIRRSSADDLIASLYQTQNRRIREVEAELERELGPRRSLELPPFPEVTINDGDGRAEILSKADYLGSKVEQHQELLDDLDAEIEDLQARQRRDQAVADFRAGLDRFDDIQLPITDEVSGEEALVEGQVLDSAVVNLSRLPIEERIRRLGLLRDEVAERVAQLAERVAQFRAQAGVGA